MRIPLLAAICVALVIALAGCGSSGGSSSTAATAAATTAPANAALVAHTAFLAKINPICATYNRRIQTIQADLQTQGARAQATGKLAPYVRPLTHAQETAALASSQFSALTPPAAEQAQAAVVGKSLKALAKLNGMLLKAAKTNDSQQFTAVSTAEQQISSQVQSVMRAYGMTSICGATS